MVLIDVDANTGLNVLMASACFCGRRYYPTRPTSARSSCDAPAYVTGARHIGSPSQHWAYPLGTASTLSTSQFANHCVADSPGATWYVR